MNAEIKKMWIDALRSGEYQQGKHALRRDDRYCCLGVLCDLKRKTTGKGGWSRDYGLPISFFDGENETLPSGVVTWAGLEEHNPVTPGGIRLSSLNDNGVSFSEIADLIEAEL